MVPEAAAAARSTFGWRSLPSRLGSSRAPSGRLHLAGVAGSERGPLPPNSPLSSMCATRALRQREAVVSLSYSPPLIFLMVEVVASAWEL